MEKKTYLIAAVSDNGVIGKDNQLPWHFPVDLKKFKELTMGSTVIMGRHTFDSIGKTLPGRENFVLTHSSLKAQEHLRFFESLNEALAHVETEKAFIVGGESVYQQALSSEFINKLSGIYLTQIHGHFPGNKYFPQIPSSIFTEKHREPLQQENPKIEFIYLENTGGTAST